MQRLTVAGRLLITAAILAALWFGFKALGGQDWLRRQQARTEQTDPGLNRPADTGNTSNTGGYDTEASDTPSGPASESSSTPSGSRPPVHTAGPSHAARRLRGRADAGAGT